MKRRARRAGWLPVAGAAALGLWLAACGGSKPAPSDPSSDPPLDDGPAAPAVASNAQVKRGIDLIQNKDFAGAKAALSSAQASHPDDPQAAFYLGVALENLNEVEPAKTAYKRALELDPKLSEASVNLSALLLDAGDASGALDVVNQGLQQSSRNPELLMNRALALETAGNLDEAVKAYGAAVAALPDNIELGFAYAELLTKTGRKDQALEELHKLASTEDPKLAQAVANLYARLKAFNECVSALDQVLQRKPSAELYVRRGVCEHELDEDVAAKADYEAAIKLDPASAPAHYYLAMHYRQKGNKKQAISHLASAVESGKGTPIAEAAAKALAELQPKRK